MRPTVELLQKLVNIPSIFPQEEDIMLFLERELSDLKPRRLDFEPGRFNLLCTIGSGYPRICLNAHSDTVPPSGQSQPVAKIDGDKLWGLGACDDKASIAAMITSFRRLAEVPWLHGTVDLLISVDEEGGGKAVQHTINQGYRCDYAIVGEPTSLDIVYAHSGILFLNLTTTGVAAHGSTPGLGHNAIRRMMALVDEIESAVTAFPDHAAVGSPSLNLGEINAGDRPNRVPDKCEAKIDIRVMPPTPVAQVKAVVDEVLAGNDWASYEIERQWEPVETPADSLLIKAVSAASSKLGISSSLKGWRGGTEAEPFRTRLDVDTIVLGPGSLDQAHSDDEYVSISETELAAQLYARSALRLLSSE